MSWKAWIASLVYTVIFVHTGPANWLLAQTRTVSSIQILLNPPMVTLSKGKEPQNFHWTFQELRNADAIQYRPKQQQQNFKNYSLFTKICGLGSPAPKVKITSHSLHNAWSKIRKSTFRTSKLGFHLHLCRTKPGHCSPHTVQGCPLSRPSSTVGCRG